MTSLIGRETEIAAVRALLADEGVRLISLTGPGGVGKTRLAVRIAEAAAATFDDGVVFVSLAPIVDPNLVLPAIAQALGLRDSGTLPLLEQITAFLGPHELLLILDNFEHLLPAAADVTDLLATCPKLTVLVTSRSVLHLSGEHEFPVPPLRVESEEGGWRAEDQGWNPTPDAVQLFVTRARAVRPDFTLSADNADAVAEICRRLDGLPLAIELAAARLRAISPAALVTLLEQRFSLLAGGPRDAPERHRTMRAAIAWSYDLLTEREQAVFRRLSIFASGCTLKAAEDVTAEGSATLEYVFSLVDHSLLHQIELPGAEPRFGMLETIREFGLDKLAGSGEIEVIAARHATWCISLAEAVRQTGGLSNAHGLDALEAEHPNLRAALSWLIARGETTAALHLSGFLAEFWLRHGHLNEGEGWLERALASDGGGATAARAEALIGLSMLLWMRHEFPRSEQLLAEAEMVARLAGDAGALAYARLHQGFVAALRGDVELAESRGEEVLRTGEAIPQRFSLNAALWLVAIAALGRGANERATDLYERLLASARAGGDETSHANALYGLAVLADRRGEPGQAMAGFAAAAAVCGGIDDRWAAGHFLDMAATTAVAIGLAEPAVRVLAAVEAMRAAVGAAALPVWVHDRQVHERALAAARVSLGAERFAAAWAEGSTLAFDAAIAEATALVGQVIPADACRQAGGAQELTPREQEILRLLVAGRPDKEIATALGIGRRTVSNHVATIRAKLDAPSRSAAAAIAVRDNLI